VGNEHDARDVLQDAYLRAFRSLRKFRGDSAFGTWLYRITVNCSASFVAKRRKSTHVALDDAAEVPEMRAESDPESVAGTADDRQRLVEALAGLPAQMRMVVVLRDVYDLPHEEIARELGISQTAAKVRLHRARRRLREQLFPATSPVAGTKPAKQRSLLPVARSAPVSGAVVALRAEASSVAESGLKGADRHAAAV
jgi:RNA polymerase sigma-70 factor (ECF subfamily)